MEGSAIFYKGVGIEEVEEDRGELKIERKGATKLIGRQ